MAGDWIAEAAAAYNADSIQSKDAYPAHVLMPIDALETILEWTFQSLPDEILVGMDADTSLPHREDVGLREWIVFWAGFCTRQSSHGEQRRFVLGAPCPRGMDGWTV